MRGNRAFSLLSCKERGRPRKFNYVEDAVQEAVPGAEKLNDSEPVNLGGGQEIIIRHSIELAAALICFEVGSRQTTA